MGRSLPLSPITTDDRDAAGRVFEQHQDRIANIARRFVKAEDVPDVVQEVGIKLCRYIGRFRGGSKIETWLYRIVVNESIEMYRRNGRLATKLEDMIATQQPEAILAPESTLLQADRRDAVRDALRRMSDARRRAAVDAIACTAVQDYSEAKTAKSSRHYAMHELRVRLANDIRIESPANGDPEHGAGDHTERPTGERGGRVDTDEAGILKGRRRVRRRRPPAGSDRPGRLEADQPDDSNAAPARAGLRGGLPVSG